MTKCNIFCKVCKTVFFGEGGLGRKSSDIQTSNNLLDDDWSVELATSGHREAETFLVVRTLTDLDRFEVEFLSHTSGFHGTVTKV